MRSNWYQRLKEFFSKGQDTHWPPFVTIYTDGASRGNPGEASIGISVSSKKKILYEYGESLGVKTNNFAEYMAVYKALLLAVQNGVKEVILYSDSQLLVEQMLGNYKVKSSSLKPIYEKCIFLTQKIPSVIFKHIKRDKNKRADEIANIVLNKEEKYI